MRMTVERELEDLKRSEREKYDKYWLLPQERRISPGMRGIDVFMADARERGCQSILDVGCGSGRTVAHLLGQGFAVEACDIAADCINEDLRPTVMPYFKAAPAWDLPYEDDSFDVIFTCDVLEHVPESLMSETLREFARVARYTYAEIAGFGRTVGGLHVHLTVKPKEWWNQLLMQTHVIESFAERRKPKTKGFEYWLRRR